MTRPRKPFGSNHPGRLPATMMKVLAAEMSDPARLRRGKQYAKDGSVLDIIIEPGTVTGEIQGSRSTPYVASIGVSSGDGMPLRRDITTSCTCPDDDNWDGHACKHVVATMFALSDEFLLEPELLDVWRNRELSTGEAREPESVSAADDDRPAGRHLRLVTPNERNQPDPSSGSAATLDRLAELLSVPEGKILAEVPDIERIEPDLPRGRQLADVMRDAIGHLRIEWD